MTPSIALPYWYGRYFTLPFEDNTLDVVFENNMFTHLAQDAVNAAREAYRVLKPQGFFAARDVDADSVVWGQHNDLIRQLDELLIS
jgi:ubiquinone/menaquinone biosynthesis C-methylase UbiE